MTGKKQGNCPTLPPLLEVKAMAARGMIKGWMMGGGRNRLAPGFAGLKPLSLLLPLLLLTTFLTATPTPAQAAIPTGLLCPVENIPGCAPLISPFGWRWGRLHAGVDLHCIASHTKILAASSGLICSARQPGDTGGYGKRVTVYHPAGDFWTTYNHLADFTFSRNNISAGAGIPVATGQAVGICGLTGNITGQHLHFELAVPKSNGCSYGGKVLINTQSSHCAYDPWPSIIKTGGGGGGGSLPPGSVPSGSDDKFELDNPGAHVGDLMETIGQGCWLCNIFALSYDISVVLSERVFEKLGAPLANLIAFALGVWVLFQAAKLMTPFGPMAGPTGIANMIFIRLGIALLVMTMLRLGFSAYNDLIQAPLMGAGVELSQELLNTASDTLGSLGSVWKKPDCEDSFIPTPYISAAATYYNNHPEANTTRRNFICLPRQMQDTLGSGMAFGISNIMAAGNLGEISGEAVVRAFDRFFSGVVLVALYFIAIIIFGMFLLDMLFRFILTGALSPIWLASAVFPNTRFAFSQGVRQLARCALTMVLMTVLIVIAAGLIGISTQNALENGKTTLKPEQKTAVEACLDKGAAAAAHCVSEGIDPKDCDMSYGATPAPSTTSGGTGGTGGTGGASGSTPTTSGTTAGDWPVPKIPATTKILITSGHRLDINTGTSGTSSYNEIYNGEQRTLESIATEQAAIVFRSVFAAKGLTVISAPPLPSGRGDNARRAYQDQVAARAASFNAYPLELHFDAPPGGQSGVISGGKYDASGNSLSENDVRLARSFGSFSFNHQCGGDPCGATVRGISILEIAMMDSNLTNLVLQGINSGNFSAFRAAMQTYATQAATALLTPAGSPLPSTPAPPTTSPVGAGKCPSVNIGAGGGVGAGMGGSVSQPPANTQPWGGSTDPEAIMFSCMMNVGGFTIGLGNPAFYQMLAGVLVVLLYMSRMYNLAAMYVGVSQDKGPTLGQLMAGITMKGIGIAGGAVAGFASAAASMTIAGGGKLLGSTLQLGSSLSPQSAPRDGSGGQPPDAGGGGGQPSGGLSASSDDMSRQSAQGGGIQSNIEIFNTIVDIEYDSYGNATINYSSSSSRAYNGNQAFNESNSDDNPPDADDNSPEQNWASRAGEAMGGGLNDLDNLFEAIGNFWKNLGKIPAKAALAALAPVILATNNAMAQISPEQQAALAKATGATKAAAAHVHRAVETLAQGTLKGASFGFELSEFTGEIALEENKKLTETKEKYKDKKAEYNKDMIT
jgi:hypothetical protein